MGETKFQPREFPESGTKAIVEEERGAKVNDYNGQYLSPEPKYVARYNILLGKNVVAHKAFQLNWRLLEINAGRKKKKKKERENIIC